MYSTKLLTTRKSNILNDGIILYYVLFGLILFIRIFFPIFSDQRMTQDIDKFCSTYCEILPRIIVSPFVIGYYCYQGFERQYY